MLKATPSNPFPEHRKLGGGGITLKQRRLITELSKQQLSKAEIADKAGCSIASVYRHAPKQSFAFGTGTTVRLSER